MTNALSKIMHNGTEYDFPEWFTPESAWTTNQVLTKTASGYDWANAPVTSVNWNTWAVTVSETVVSGDSGTTYTVKVANSDPTSWTPATTITFVL